MATTEIKVNLGITADNAKALASINGVKVAFDQVAGAATKADTAGTMPNTARQLSALRATLAGFRNALVAYAGLRVVGSVIGDIATRRADHKSPITLRSRPEMNPPVGSARIRQRRRTIRIPAGESALAEVARRPQHAHDHVRRTSRSMTAPELESLSTSALTIPTNAR